MKSPMKKRSIVVFGRKTSVSLEDEFWEATKLIAAERRSTITVLVERIAGGRVSNLSSAIRTEVIDHYMRLLADTSVDSNPSWPSDSAPSESSSFTTVLHYDENVAVVIPMEPKAAATLQDQRTAKQKNLAEFKVNIVKNFRAERD